MNNFQNTLNPTSICHNKMDKVLELFDKLLTNDDNNIKDIDLLFDEDEFDENEFINEYNLFGDNNDINTGTITSTTELLKKSTNDNDKLMIEEITSILKKSSPYCSNNNNNLNDNDNFVSELSEKFSSGTITEQEILETIKNLKNDYKLKKQNYEKKVDEIFQINYNELNDLKMIYNLNKAKLKKRLELIEQQINPTTDQQQQQHDDDNNSYENTIQRSRNCKQLMEKTSKEYYTLSEIFKRDNQNLNEK